MERKKSTIINLIEMGRVYEASRIYDTLKPGGKIICFSYVTRGLLIKVNILLYSK